MNVVDLCCGRGTWSDGFARLGFACTGVDVVNVGYPYKLILSDLRTLDSSTLGKPDVVVGSPPCRDFSRFSILGKFFWRDPPNPKRGLEIVHAFLRIIEELQPRYWLMENVPELSKYLDLKANCTIYMQPTMKRSLWGVFPKFLIPMEMGIPKRHVKGKLRPWLRAAIPFPVAYSLAEAILNDMKNNGGSN